MSNMSYCRFQNTNGDLRDCEDALESLLNGDGDEGPLSERELEAAKALVARCFAIADLVSEAIGKPIDELLDGHGDDDIASLLADANDEARRCEDQPGAA